MKKSLLLMILVLAGHWSAASAATPIFELNTPHTPAPEGRRLPAIDTYRPGIERASFDKTVQMTFASHLPLPRSSTPVVFSALDASRDVVSDVNVAADSFSRRDNGAGASGKMISSVNFRDDSLFYFLRSFKPQPLKKPERWTMLLVGLGLLLYQVRRRPLRTSIGFYPASKTIGPLSA